MTGNGLLFRLLMALVILSPIPFGSHRPWAWSLLALLTGLLLILWGWLWGSGRVRLPVGWSRLWPMAVPFGLCLGWVILQLSPLAPAAWHHPFWGEAARALPAGTVTPHVSLDPTGGWTALMRLLSYGGVFWLAVQVGRNRERAQQGLRWLAVAAVVHAIYGLTQYFSGLEFILWYPKWAYLGDLTGSFVNRNAFGAFAGVGLLCCLGLAAARIAEDRGFIRGARDAADLLLTRTAPYLIGITLLGTALLLSHSRGAFLATGAAVFLLLGLLVFGRVISRGFAWGLTAATLVVGGMVLAVSGDMTVTRLADSTDIQGDRGQLYRLSLDAIAEAPVTGYGLGSFASAFQLYRDTSMPRPVVYDFAHNLHLELLMDLGIPAALLLYASVLVALGLCLRGVLTRQRDQVHPALALAAAVLLAGHGLVDFSLQMPAIAVLFAWLLGVGVAQSWRSSRS